MRRDKIIYWSATAIVCGIMAFSAVNFNLSHPFGPFEKPFSHLGLPDYLRIELTIAKALAVLALLIPPVPRKVKELAYFGFGITLISASIAHFSVGDGVMFVIDPLLFFGALIVSYAYFNKIADEPLKHESGKGKLTTAHVCDAVGMR
jgi:DoxX-like family